MDNSSQQRAVRVETLKTTTTPPSQASAVMQRLNVASAVSTGNRALFYLREKPGLTSALWLSALSLLLLVIATFTPWMSLAFASSQGGATFLGRGWVSLTEAQVCFSNPVSSPLLNRWGCGEEHAPRLQSCCGTLI